MARIPAYVIVTLILSVLCVTSAVAQQDKSSAVKLIEADEALQRVTEQYRAQDGSLNMSTPLSTILRLEEAIARKDYASAAEFFDMRYLDPAMERTDPSVLLQQFIYIWSKQRILDISTISDQPEGHLDDGLPKYRDSLGSIELLEKSVPIYLQRIPDGTGERVWKLSNASVAEIPAMWEELGYGEFAGYLKQVLPQVTFLGLQNWQLAYLILMAVLGWPITGLLCLGLKSILVRHAGPFQDAIARFLSSQFRIFLYIISFDFIIRDTGFPLRAQVLLQSIGLAHIATTILLLGIINLMIGFQTRRMLQAGNDYYIALLKPVATVLKILLVITIALVWASGAGFNISAIIAGLGVGSLAVALAAQKTLENIIGAITIYTARPIKPGDFCRFGSTAGVVEEIGLRSTVIRTLNRTLVSIPNSVFSAAEVENFSQRDRIRYYRHLRLEVGSRALMETILLQIRELFAAHEQINQDTVSIRLEEIADNTVQIRIDAGVRTTDYQQYLAVAEALNLSLIDIVTGVGARFSGLAQNVTVQNPQHIDLRVSQENMPEPSGVS